MASNDIQDRIRKERDAIDKANARIAELTDTRVQQLEAGNDTRVDEIESEIKSAENAIARGEERLTLLDQRLVEAQDEERAKELDTLVEQANRARTIGEKLIRTDYQKAAATVSATMAKLSAIDEFIRSVNYQLQRAGRPLLDSTNAIRCTSRQVIERTRREELGVADPRHPNHADVFVNQNNIAINRKTNERVEMYGQFDVPYTETINPYQPDPLPQSVRLPGIDGTPDSLWPTANNGDAKTLLKQMGIGEDTGTVSKIKSLVTPKAA